MSKDLMIDSFLHYGEPDPFELRVGGEEDADSERFEIDDLGKAEWAIRKIARYEELTAQSKEFAEQEIARINKWFEEQKKFNDGNIEWLKKLLRPFAAQQIQGTNKKSVELPSGTLKFTKALPKYERKEEDLFLFVKNNYPDYILTKESVAWNEFKKTLKVEDGRCITSDGEVLDCVTVIVPDEDNFTVKPERGFDE